MARPSLQPTEIEEFKERVCEVATKLLAREGDDGLSMRRLSREVGCSHAKAYRYFANKEDLLVAVRARAFERYRSFVEERLEGVEGTLERVRQLCLMYADYARSHEAEFRMMFSFRQPDSLRFPKMKDAVFGAWGVFLGEVQEAVEEGLLVGEPKRIANLLWAGIHGVVTLGVAEKLVMGMKREALVSSMTESLLRAHSPESQRKSPS